MLIAPGAAPPMFCHTRRTARPIVALARQPGPKTPALQLTSRAARTGPLSTRRRATASVVPDTPTRAKAWSQIASTPAITAGRYSARHPAMTALTAIFSTVARPRRGATRPISSSRDRPLASTAAATRAAVGGTTGRPSVTPRAWSDSSGSSGGMPCTVTWIPADAHLHVLDESALDLDAHFLDEDGPGLDGGDPSHALARLGLSAPPAIDEHAAIRFSRPLLLLDLRTAHAQHVLAGRAAGHDALEHLAPDQHTALAGQDLGARHAQMQPRSQPSNEGDGGASEHGAEGGSGGQEEEWDDHDHHTLKLREVAELDAEVLGHHALARAHEERDHLRALQGLAEPPHARGGIDLLDAQVLRLGEMHGQFRGSVGEADGPVPVLRVHGEDRPVTHLVVGERELMSLAREERLEPARLSRLDHSARPHAETRHERRVGHLLCPRNADPRPRRAQAERGTVLHEGDVRRLTRRLGRRLHAFAVDVLDVERQPAAAHHAEAASLHILLQGLVALAATERARHLPGPQEEDVLLEAAALARIDVERPADLHVHRAERRRHGGANGERADREGGIGDGGDKDLRGSDISGQERERGEKRDAARQSHRQMIADLC